MKNHKVLTMALVGAVAAVGLAFAPAAHAEGTSVKDYQREMRLLLPVIQGWNHQLDLNLTAMQTKPELACNDEYHSLVALGKSLAEDLAGTALNAPAPLVGLNLQAAEGLREVVRGAALASQDCDGENLPEVRDQVSAGQDRYDENIARVRSFVIGFSLR